MTRDGGTSMPGWGGGGANSGDDVENVGANNNPGPDIEQAEEQEVAEESPEDRGITDPSEISG